LETQALFISTILGHLRWEVDYPPSQPVGSGFEPHWRPKLAKLPSFGGYSLEALPYSDNIGAEDEKSFLLKQTYKSFLFLSVTTGFLRPLEIHGMHFCRAGRVQQAQQSTLLAEGL